MTTTLTLGATTVIPELVLGYRSIRTSKNLIHPIIARPDPDVTLTPAGLRTGTLEMLFLTLAAALVAENLHAIVGILELQDTDLPALNMHYVTSGAIELSLDPETRLRWFLRVDFTEVLP